MNIVRWDPFHELEDMSGRLNRLFSRRGIPAGEDEALFFADWTPAADVQETDKEYLIKADLPEIKKEDVKVEFEDGVLTLEGGAQAGERGERKKVPED